MTVSALSRVLERRVATYGSISEASALDHLERVALDRESAQRAIDLACVRGRVVRSVGDTGPLLRLPRRTWQAA
jgi:hypothetical protein